MRYFVVVQFTGNSHMRHPMLVAFDTKSAAEECFTLLANDFDINTRAVIEMYEGALRLSNREDWE